jgi:hypothetical protein
MPDNYGRYTKSEADQLGLTELLFPTKCAKCWKCGHKMKPTHNKLGSTTLTPNKELSRRERYNVIAKHLVELVGIAPSYRPLVGEGKDE